MAEYLEQNIEDVKNYVQKNYTYRQISDIFKQHFPAFAPRWRQYTVLILYAYSYNRIFCAGCHLRTTDKYILIKKRESEPDSLVMQTIKNVWIL